MERSFFHHRIIHIFVLLALCLSLFPPVVPTFGTSDRVAFATTQELAASSREPLTFIPEAYRTEQPGATALEPSRMAVTGQVEQPSSQSLRVLIPPWGGTGATDRIWSFQHGTWIGIQPPYAGVYWHSLNASPHDPDTWLLLGNSSSSTQLSIASGTIKDGEWGHQPSLADN